jgi:hypothetical protein
MSDDRNAGRLEKSACEHNRSERSRNGDDVMEQLEKSACKRNRSARSRNGDNLTEQDEYCPDIG